MNVAIEKSLFSRLFSYRPRENRSERENFFTEAFVGLMEREPELLEELFKELTGKKVNNVKISSQVPYPSTMTKGGIDRPDITIIGQDEDEERHIIFIESKLDSKGDVEQLNGYVNVLSERNEKSKTLIYITQFSEEQISEEQKIIYNEKGIVFKQMRWYKIYLFFKRKDNIAPLVNELIRFMEELNMTFDIKLSELLAGVTFSRARDKFVNLLYEGWNNSGLQGKEKTSGQGRTYSNPEVIYCTTPYFGKAEVQLSYGIWFDTKKNGYWDLIGDHKELPILFLVISKWSNEDSIRDEYKAIFQAFIKDKENWKLLKKPDCVIIKKQYNINHFGVSDISQELLKFFIDSFNEIKDAPFFQ